MSSARPPVSAGVGLLLLDAVAAVVIWLVAVALLGRLGDAATLLLPPAGTLLFLYALGLYRRDAMLSLRRAATRVPLAACLGVGLAWFVSAVLPLPSLQAPVLAAAAVCFTVSGMAARAIFAQLRNGQMFHRRVLIVGAGKRAWDLVWLLGREGGTLNYEILFVTGPSMGEVDPRLAEDPKFRIEPDTDGFLAAARRFDADEIVVAPDERRGLAMESLLQCRAQGFPVTEYLTFLEREIRRIDLHRLELGWLLYADGFSFSLIDRTLKRALDIAVSGTVLLLAGIPLLAAALVVKLQDGGPALYRQNRVTQGGRVFSILKLRSMRIDAEKHGATWAAERDPRITRFGNFLRRSRLDELPQLINILRGDMSFVGPRPERPEFVDGLAAKLPLYNERHVVKAGLTGWAQVNYPYGASLDDARSKLSYDLYYVKNFSVLFDLTIIIQTMRVVLWPDGVR